MSATLSPLRVTECLGHPASTTLVFLHGVYHGSWAFRSFCERMSGAGFSLALVDVRGHWGEGRITRRTDLGFADYLDDVREALDRITGNKVIVGHSLGGLLALAFKPRVDVIGRVLISTPLPGLLRSRTPELFSRFPLRFLRFVLLRQAWALYHHEPFINRYLLSEHTTKQSRAAAIREIKAQHEPHRLFRDVLSLEISERVPRIRTLILWGEDDPSMTPEAVEELRALTGGDAVAVAEAGHDIMLDPGAAAAIDSIMRWLPSPPPGGGW